MPVVAVAVALEGEDISGQYAFSKSIELSSS
jgi:hypothetical protein